MHLEISNLATIYGKNLFVLPNLQQTDVEPDPTKSQAIDVGKSSFTINQVEGARLAVVLSEKEATSETLMTLYENILDAMGQTSKTVTTVTVHTTVYEKDLSQIQIEFILIFGKGTVLLPTNPFTLASGCMVYTVPSLQEMQNDVAQKRLGWECIKQFKDRL